MIWFGLRCHQSIIVLWSFISTRVPAANSTNKKRGETLLTLVTFGQECSPTKKQPLKQPVICAFGPLIRVTQSMRNRSY